MAGQATNPASIPSLFRKQFELCRVKKGETVILLSDLNTRRDYILAAFAAASDLGAHAYEIGVSRSPDWLRIGVDVIGEAKGMKQALVQGDLIVAFHPPNFSNWQKEVRANGGRVLSISKATVATRTSPKQ
jgi:2,5-dihydroxypyridine 5,6-dioxygenase